MSATTNTFVTSAVLWKYGGPVSWYFLTLPTEVANRIRPHAAKVGFGSVRVQACIGDTAWKTSLFPDKKSGSYVLPVKAEVRKKELLEEGAEVVVFLEV